MSLPFAAPALPLHTAGPYVVAAYLVFLALILSYVAIMARRLTATQREVRRLARQMDERPAEEDTPREETLV